MIRGKLKFMLNSRQLMLILVLMAMVTGCFGPPGIVDRASVKGTVTNAETGRSISGIKISSGQNNATTDQDGGYSISDIPPGETITITVNEGEEKGYSKTFAGIILEPGETKTLNFELSDIELPLITLINKVESTPPDTEIQIGAIITDNENVPNAKIFYRKESDTTFIESALSEATGDSTYTGVIPKEIVNDEDLIYYLYAEDGTDVATLPPDAPNGFTITVTLVTLNVNTPTDGLITSESTITVNGIVEIGATLIINGIPVTPDSNGQFSHEVTLVEGENTITVIATDIEGNTTTITRTVTFILSPVSLTVSSPEDGFITNVLTLTVAGNAEVGAIVTVNDVDANADPDTGDFSSNFALEEGNNPIRIKAENDKGDTATVTRNVILDTIKPDAPVMTTEDEYTQGASNTVSWDKVTGASEYYVEHATSDTFSSSEGNSGWINGTSHTFSDLSDGQEYHYRVKAGDLATNESGWSNSASSTQDNTPPNTSVDVLATYQTTSTFNVAYTATDWTSGVKHVELFFRKDGGNWMKYGSTFTSSPISFNSSTTDGEGVYEFYTNGIDNVSNLENAPSSSDASTTVDTTVPTVDSTNPASGATGIVINTAITANFSEEMDASSINTTTFTLVDNNSITVTGTATYSGTTATFTPLANLSGSVTYTATIMTGVKDKTGNQLAANKIWSFTTETVIITIASGHHHNIVLKSDGTVWAWGYNSSGQLGNGTQIGGPNPVQVCDAGQIAPCSTYLTDVTAIAGGQIHTISLKSNGTVWTWGRNDFGQLGDGLSCGINCTTPVLVSGLAGVVAITSGQRHSIALKDDGTVWAWGFNSNGQLGNGATTDSTIPIQVKGPGGSGSLSDVIAIKSGKWDHTIALKSDGTVWTWGYNSDGQLGDGTQTDRNAPIQVCSIGASAPCDPNFLSSGKAFAAGGRHTIALKNDGTVRTWGKNSNGQLGDGTILIKLIPVQVNTLTGVVAIAAGVSHSVALKNDGTVLAWGLNTSGQLGDGTTTQRITPAQVNGLTGVIAIAGGQIHTISLKSNGTVWAWGRNDFGQLGATTSEMCSGIPCSTTPVQVGGL